MKEKKSTIPWLREHPKYPEMYYFKQKTGRWSKDFVNLTRASWSGMVEQNLLVGAKVVGNLPFRAK
jgi:hypothetical protein